MLRCGGNTGGSGGGGPGMLLGSSRFEGGPTESRGLVLAMCMSWLRRTSSLDVGATVEMR